jgi:hypothetical protein
MGRLVEGQIKTLFHGVSRQPDSMRLPGQVEDASNVDFTVESGGFRSRFGTELVAKLTVSSPSADVAVHSINRDVEERYTLVMPGDGTLEVFDTLTGTERTVNPFSMDVAEYITAMPEDLAFVTVADYTFVLNRSKVAAMGSVTAPAPIPMAVVEVDYVRDGSFTITLNGTLTATTSGSNTMSHETLATALRAALVTAAGAGWSITGDNRFIFIRRDDAADFTVNVTDPLGRGLFLTKDKIKDTTKLPARAPDGMTVKIEGEFDSGYYLRFDQDAGTTLGTWKETVKPGDIVAFNAATMPHQLVRESDGSFTLSEIQWDNKKVGDTTTVPDPEFIGQKINDLTFWRNRLVILSEETTSFSQAGDYFNFWPDKSTEVLDSDPFSLTATTNKVSILRYAVPFRKTLFTTADAAQFEISAQIVTPKQTVMDLSTEYDVSRRCRPIANGDSLFFAAESGDEAALLEYSYDDTSLTNVAADVTKHCKGFVPSPLLELDGDSVTGTVFARSGATPDSLYVYRYYFNGTEKAQSAWSRYRFNGAVVKASATLGSYLYIVIKRGDGLYLERMPLAVSGYQKYRWVPCLDRQQRRSTGTYNSGTNRTTWTLTETYPGILAITSEDFGTAAMRDLTLTVDSPTTVSAPGNWATGEVMFGVPFESSVTFSKQYLRDAQGAATITGRLQLRYWTLAYQDTGYFKIEVTPEEREPRVYTFTSRRIGSALNEIGSNNIRSGRFRFPVWTRGDTATVRLINDSFLPMTITSAEWTGFFNEVARQG